MRAKLVSVVVLTLFGSATAVEFHPYPVGLTHQSTVLESFSDVAGLLKADCETRCGDGCEGFLLIDGLCRELIASPFTGGLAHHGQQFGLTRINTPEVHHVFRKTNNPNFLSQEGIHDCKQDPCVGGNAFENSCLVYGECVCKSRQGEVTYSGETCAVTASQCLTLLAEVDRSASCPCGTRLETNVVDLDIEDASMDACIAETAQVSLARTKQLSQCASQFAGTAKLKDDSLVQGVFRRMGAGTSCVSPEGQEPDEGNKYHTASAEECEQIALGNGAFQFTPSTVLTETNCIVFSRVQEVEYIATGATACYVNYFFQYENGESVKVETYEKAVDATKRATTCLVSQQVTTAIDSLELTKERFSAMQTVAQSFGYRASDGILVMQNRRLQNRLEDQIRFLNLMLLEDSDFFCKTLCPCGTYTSSPADSVCTSKHETFRASLEHAAAQMNCAFRPNWDANDPLSLSVFINAVTCTAFYRDRDSDFYQSILAEGRARASFVIAKASQTPLGKLLPGAFANTLNVLLESASSPVSGNSLSLSGSEALLRKVVGLEDTMRSTFQDLQAGDVTNPDGTVRSSFQQKAETFDMASKEILSALAESRRPSQQVLSAVSAAVQTLNETIQQTLDPVRIEFQKDLEDYIERFPGLSPKFDKEIERAHAAFGVFQGMVNLVPMLFREAVHVATLQDVRIREVTLVEAGQLNEALSDMERFRNFIVRFKVLSEDVPTLAPLVQAMVNFHDDWQSLTARNDGQVLDLDSSSSYGRFRELMLAVASTASANAYLLIFMTRALRKQAAEQDPTWTLSSSGTDLMDALLLRFTSLFVHDLGVCPRPITTKRPLKGIALSQRAQSNHARGSFRDALKPKTSDTLLSCAKFHRVFGDVVAKTSMVLGSAFETMLTAQNEVWTTQDNAVKNALPFFLQQVGSLPYEARDHFFALFFLDRFWHIQSRWARHIEKLCHVFKSSSADYIPGLNIGMAFSLNTRLCSVSSIKGLVTSRGLVYSQNNRLGWNMNDVLKYGPIACLLNSDGTVTGLYNGTGRTGDMSTVSGELANIVALKSNAGAFAALRTDGKVITWGDPLYGGDASSIEELQSGVEKLFSANDRDAVIQFMGSSALVDFFSFYFMALKRDGTFVVWGLGQTFLLKNVAKIVVGFGAGAVIHTDRSVSAFGSKACGGDISSVQERLLDVEEVKLNTYKPPTLRLGNPGSVEERIAALCGFLQQTYWARKTDGSVVVWGPSDVHGANTPEAKKLLSSGIAKMYPKQDAILFVRNDRTAFTLGPPTTTRSYDAGTGNAADSAPSGADSSAVSSQLREVKSVFHQEFTFATLREDGKLVVWGANATKPEGVMSDISGSAGDTSSVADFLQADVEQVVTGSYNYCAVKGEGGAIKCWGGSSRHDEDVDNLIDALGGVRRQTRGYFDVYTDSFQDGFLVRTNSGHLVHWGATNLNRGGIQVGRVPDVPFRQVNFDSTTIVLEDGSVAFFSGYKDERNRFQQVQARLKDVERVLALSLSGSEVIYVAEVADGRLIPWSWGQPTQRVTSFLEVLEGLSFGSEVEITGRLVTRARDTENGLESATKRWLRPVQSKQVATLAFEPSCDIVQKSILKPLLQDGLPQVVDVSIASFSRFCSGNLGVTSVSIKLLDANNALLAAPAVRFKMQAVTGAFEAKYFQTEKQFVETISQRSGAVIQDEYVFDFPSPTDRNQKGTLADAGNVLPSPYTKWLLSLETPWPEDVKLPASLSLVFTLSGGECHSDSVAAATIQFSGERTFFSQDGMDSLALATSCGGSTLLAEEPEVVTTSSPTLSPANLPTREDPSSEATSWVLPVAVSGGAVAVLAIGAIAFFLFVKKRQAAAAPEDDTTLAPTL